MEEAYFNEIRAAFCSKETGINAGKMMSSEAITYNDKVFAFFSRNKQMVFKLGKEFDPDDNDFEIRAFNPFKKRGPLNGWFEVPYTAKKHWEPLARKALNILKQ